jgi:nucleoside-diphosphate-sugar epimerase
MRILITGGAGYISSTLVPLLLASGHQVTAYDTLEHGTQPLLACFREPVFRLIRGDIRDRERLRQAAASAEAVVHLAAISGYPACAREPEQATEVNVLGTKNVVAAAGAERPVVLASTVSCYGAVHEGLCSEQTPARPVSHYGRTKLEAEAAVLAGPRGIVLRLATAYGLSPRMRLDLLVNSFVFELARGRPLAVYEPEARRAFIHVRDAARAFAFALAHAERMAGGLFNTGDENQNRSKRELVELIRRRLPSAEVSFRSVATDGDQRDYAVSFARLQAEGFRAETTLEQGIDELLRASPFL